MVEVKNIEVFNLDRAIKAINNSYNVGEIDTTTDITERQLKVAKTLGGNMDSYQSHSAFLKGVLVSFDIKGNGVFMPELLRYHFITIKLTDDFDNSKFTKYITEDVLKIVKLLYNNYVKTKSDTDYMKFINNLPRGVEYLYKCSTNYLQLKTIVIQRFHHKNKEDWKNFIEACYSMSRFRELCGFEGKEWDLDNF